jgi:hypothetical protein
MAIFIINIIGKFHKANEIEIHFGGALSAINSIMKRIISQNANERNQAVTIMSDSI